MRESEYIFKDTDNNYYINMYGSPIYISEIKSISKKELSIKYNLSNQNLRCLFKHLNQHGFTIDKKRKHDLYMTENSIKKLYSLGLAVSDLAYINNVSKNVIYKIVENVQNITDKPRAVKTHLLKIMTYKIKEWLESGLTHQKISEKLRVISRPTITNYINHSDLREFK